MMSPMELTGEYLEANIDIDRIVDRIEQRGFERLLKTFAKLLFHFLLRVSCHVLIICVAYFGICMCVMMLDNPNVSKSISLLSVVIQYVIIRISVRLCNMIPW